MKLGGQMMLVYITYLQRYINIFIYDVGLIVFLR